ncbi:MAG: serpin family protein [Planctomycetes bacterium]|nr:serpin family protein [Planctomycetota bacterium]
MKTILLLSVGLFVASTATAAEPAPKNQVAADNNAFAFDLYAKVRTKEGNLFFSPASMSTALAMTYAGARGTTADEMAKVMHFTLGQEKLHPAFAALLKEMNGEEIAPDKRGYQLSVANALWGQAGYPWKKDFLALTKENYKAGLTEVNFAASEAARQIINNWVEKETREKIKDLIPKDVLKPTTRLVLTNAIYFKGDWLAKFDKKETADKKFLLSADKSVEVPMMHRKGSYGYFENDEVQILEMPYKGKELSMLVLLPRKANGIGDLEKNLTFAKFAELTKFVPMRNEVDVTLPKFKIELDLPLTKVLQEMGMKTAFIYPVADFSGMDGSRELFISAVLHKAFVEVNEEGTEAAAATAVVFGTLTLNLPPPPTFRADHPFVFVIRDNRNGSVLFMGRLSEPVK